jgi:hypothetical protein
VPEQTKAESDHPWTFDEVLQQELDYIKRRRVTLGLSNKIDSTAETTALCLSGGGVRSASFCLGVVIALARKGVLKNFDYLSTVSGGGFTGGFLSRWVREEGYEKVEERLADSHEFANPSSPLAHVRKYIAYLTPRIGLFSLDSISGAGLFIRNLFINWLIVVPIIMAGLAAVLLLNSGFQLLAQLDDPRLAFSVYMLTGVTLCGYAISYALFRRPGLASAGDDQPFDKLLRNYSGPIFLGSLFIAAGIVAVKSQSSTHHMPKLIIALICIVALAVIQIFASSGGVTTAMGLLKRVRATILPLAAQCIVFVLFGYILLNVILQMFEGELNLDSGLFGPLRPPLDSENMANVYFILGPLVFTLTLYLSEVIYVALRGNPVEANFEREWLARSTGALFSMPLAWMFLTFSVIYGPQVVTITLDYLAGPGGGGMTQAVSATTLSGVIVALLSRSKQAVALVKQGYESWGQFGARWGLVLVMPVFLLLLIALLTGIIMRIAVYFFDSFPAYTTFLGIAAAFTVTGLIFDFLITTNVFTLHGIYRNRLVRSFVGAANPLRTRKQRETGFLNFFPEDNLPLFKLAHTADASGLAPPQLHIINMALNVPGSADIALQERKALPFSASPLCVGSRSIGHKRLNPERNLEEDMLGSYRRSDEYAKGDGDPLTLGGAIALSGAAVSPNMGYHSDPALSVLLALFNLRLGGWYGNPGTPGSKKYTKNGAPMYMWDGPPMNLGTIAVEAVGSANENRSFVHLSDGGHFDNLGLYEMLARRCKLIVAVDAGCDPQTALADLGIGQRLAKLDLGASIEFSDKDIADLRDCRKRVVIGSIGYHKTSGKPASSGTLIYIKPRILQSDQAIVTSYRARSPEFPHEPTSNQWFTESQFAAYLALGESAGSEIDDSFLSDLRARKTAAAAKKKGRAR